MVPPWSLPGSTPFNKVLPGGARHAPVEPPLTHEDIAFLQYTGGTTGVSKGAMLTHGNIVANLQQTSAWIGTGLKEGKEIAIPPLPMYHIFALPGSCLVNINLRPHNTPIPNPPHIPHLLTQL